MILTLTLSQPSKQLTPKYIQAVVAPDDINCNRLRAESDNIVVMRWEAVEAYLGSVADTFKT